MLWDGSNILPSSSTCVAEPGGWDVCTSPLACQACSFAGWACTCFGEVVGHTFNLQALPHAGAGGAQLCPTILRGPSIRQESAQTMAMRQHKGCAAGQPAAQAALGPQWLVFARKLHATGAGLLEGWPFNQGPHSLFVLSHWGTVGPDVPVSHCLSCPRFSLLVSTLHAVV